MWVKICGNTNLDDALLAVDAGADAVGFVFAQSKRQVTADQVAAITKHLPANVERIGVFDSHNPEVIANTAQASGLSAVQLHGGFDEELLKRVADILVNGESMIQTIHWSLEDPLAAARVSSEFRRLEELGITDRVLIDSKAGSATGGTGVCFDWNAAKEVITAAPSSLRLIVAGGLRPENIAEAVHALRPWGVDVSSGVEASPGRKDPALVRRFVENAHRAGND